jgi:hypothetical protein
MALFIRSTRSQDFAQSAGINFLVRRPGAAAPYRRMINFCSKIWIICICSTRNVVIEAARGLFPDVLSIFAHENVIWNVALAINRPE